MLLFDANTVEGHTLALDTLISTNANAKAVNEPCATSLRRQRRSGAAENVAELEQREADRSCTLDARLSPQLATVGDSPDLLQEAESSQKARCGDLDIPVAKRKATQSRRLPARYRQDVLPQPLPPVEVGQPWCHPTQGTNTLEGATTGTTAAATPIPPPPLSVLTSGRNSFGVMRKYHIRPNSTVTHDPDRQITLHDLSDLSPPFPRNVTRILNPYGPFSNLSALLIGDWYWNSNNKSYLDFQKLISILKQPNFSLEDVTRINWAAAFKELGANKDDLCDGTGSWIEDDGWKTTQISIDVPFHSRMKNSGLDRCVVGDFHHRSIVSVIKEKILNPDENRQFHYHPYHSTWKASEASPEVDLYGELYASQAFRDAHEELQNQPDPTPGESFEKVVVALMLASDSTHLTSFGDAQLWPCYLMFGNESKYRRCQPSQHLCHQIAYFKKLSDRFSDYLKTRNGGKLPSDAFMTHCSRELFHAQWSVLLDDELLDAMKNGIVLMCPDGRRRRFYPRIFTYSADYPEKILVAGIRNNGVHPCHRCLIQKSDLSNLGAPNDNQRCLQQRIDSDDRRRKLVADARKEILENNYAVDGNKVESLLKPQSLVPVDNAFFAPRFLPFVVSILPALVVDILHEFEVGVWKRLFIHLIRLLEAFSQASGITLTAELDYRYRLTPAFGRDAVRKFGVNASAMKRKAARDFEDLLQCAIPAFECLLPPPHNAGLMKLLFIFAQWHALAKLRLHNDHTLALLDYTTTQLGAHTRRFDKDTCSRVSTKELAKEAEARARREAKGKGKGTASVARKPATLGIFTIKFHFLGDYVPAIRRFGTSDSYSTEISELSHRLPKSWFPRTDKKDYQEQMAHIERRQARLARIRAEILEPSAEGANYMGRMNLEHAEAGVDSRYVMASNQNQPFDLGSAAVNCVGAIHHDQYLICNVMLLNADFSEPGTHSLYLYSRVLGIYHANVSYIGVLPDGTRRYDSFRLDVVWGQWYEALDHPIREEFQLDRLRLCPVEAPESLHFMDPSDILRAVHLIPQFSLGKVDTLPPKSRLVTPQESEWKAYYINRFVDRDMFMRYQYGMSVGHVYMHPLFPVPKLPSIPSDFDYCLQESPSQAQASGSNVTLTNRPSETTLTSSPSPPILHGLIFPNPRICLSAGRRSDKPR
ncbi:hypothetical protein H1R20_g1191, partial [Candolleomyces eurysporus]